MVDGERVVVVVVVCVVVVVVVCVVEIVVRVVDSTAGGAHAVARSTIAASRFIGLQATGSLATCRSSVRSRGASSKAIVDLACCWHTEPVQVRIIRSWRDSETASQHTGFRCSPSTIPTRRSGVDDRTEPPSSWLLTDAQPGGSEVM